MKNNFWFLLIAFSIIGCTSNENDDECGDFIPAPLYINLELIDSVTNENLLTNQTFTFENLNIVAQNDNEFLFQRTANDQILVSFDYNNAGGVYVFKNGEEVLFTFTVNVDEVTIGCYLHNKIGSVLFNGANFEHYADQNLYRIKL